MSAAAQKTFTVACLQMTSGGNVSRNLSAAEALLQKASADNNIFIKK